VFQRKVRTSSTVSQEEPLGVMTVPRNMVCSWEKGMAVMKVGWGGGVFVVCVRWQSTISSGSCDLAEGLGVRVVQD
jgi:hypothetical protein